MIKIDIQAEVFLKNQIFSSNVFEKLLPDRVRGLRGLILTKTSEIKMNTGLETRGVRLMG